MKIATIVGARPQFIKAAVVSRAIAKYNDDHTDAIEEIIVHTGQHFDANMSEIFFEQLSIPKPDYDLGINSCGHGEMTGRMLEDLERVLLDEKPDWVLIYGDTNSTLAGALAAKKLQIRLAHVEAGLRSFNMKMPEEQNRLVADRLADILFCPTEIAVSNLNEEGIGNSQYGERVVLVGDVMYDASIYYSNVAKSVSTILHDLNLTDGNYALATIHRAENTDDVQRLEAIFSALNELAEEVEIVLPLHPRTKKIVEQKEIDTRDITVIDPVSYLDMVMLEKHCQMILTDSGGVQKEAYFFKKTLHHA
jgi:UDP-GlcNAc3NAcA epimerase